ncbi:hypothetical protein GALMADRAFT_234899 [Galerina marginata CBS 339.88]|uniref:non-specific serine/threonine protein kinase n=1 Tax=Galerina marginata (strain CBS 339.88) TaxID=685588 RepID=A0A067U326_GALM3|nr:hypothetical protein GALMADRAFT_234899 [Galerina marginata CBS 339.88]
MSQFPEERLDLSAEQGFGYFPAYPGLALKQNRYKVIRKLGFGPRSSVWLTTDLTGDFGYTAIKILTVHATGQKTNELPTLQAIKAAFPTDLPNLHDNFVEESHHGKHQCFVLSVLGPDVETLRLTSPTKSLPVHVVSKIISSVLEPLSALHNTGTIHGAITADNILFFVGQRVEDLDPTLAKLPQSVVQDNITVGAVEYPIVRSQPIPHGYKWNEKQESIADCGIYLSNVGHAQSIRNNPTWEKTSANPALRPPEVILGTDFNIKTDIWMLGCATYQLLTGEPLVPAAIAEDDNDQLGWVMGLTRDRIKEAIALKSKNRDDFFTDEGIFFEDIPETDLAAALKASGKVAEQDIPETVKFIERCLTLDPADRPDVNALHNERWVQKGLACSCGYCG